MQIGVNRAINRSTCFLFANINNVNAVGYDNYFVMAEVLLKNKILIVGCVFFGRHYNDAHHEPMHHLTTKCENNRTKSCNTNNVETLIKKISE